MAAATNVQISRGLIHLQDSSVSLNLERKAACDYPRPPTQDRIKNNESQGSGDLPGLPLGDGALSHGRSQAIYEGADTSKRSTEVKTTSYIHLKGQDVRFEGKMDVTSTYIISAREATIPSQSFYLFLERHQVEDMILACDEALTAGGDKPLDLRPEAS